MRNLCFDKGNRCNSRDLLPGCRLPFLGTLCLRGTRVRGDNNPLGAYHISEMETMLECVSLGDDVYIHIDLMLDVAAC